MTVSTQRKACFITHPRTGIENDALLVESVGVFDILDLWLVNIFDMTYPEFLALRPEDMAEIAAERYYAGKINRLHIE